MDGDLEQGGTSPELRLASETSTSRARSSIASITRVRTWLHLVPGASVSLLDSAPSEASCLSPLQYTCVGIPSAHGITQSRPNRPEAHDAGLKVRIDLVEQSDFEIRPRLVGQHTTAPAPVRAGATARHYARVGTSWHTGRRTRKVVPRLTTLSTEISPPTCVTN